MLQSGAVNDITASSAPSAPGITVRPFTESGVAEDTPVDVTVTSNKLR